MGKQMLLGLVRVWAISCILYRIMKICAPICASLRHLEMDAMEREMEKIVRREADFAALAGRAELEELIRATRAYARYVVTLSTSNNH